MSASVLPAFGLVHICKDDAGIALAERDIPYLQHRGFFLDTCLRQLAVLPQTFSPQSQLETRIEWRTDSAAYNFMLQTATGLNSAIVGESNILGQFKHSWLKWLNCAPASAIQKLDPVMQYLFADSASIRHQHLHGIGGQSYGPLVRKLLSPNTRSRILIVGAGDLSRSILPYLQNFQLGIWNRKPKALAEAGNARVFAPADAAIAADWATHMIISTPADADNDRRWFELADNHMTAIVHLGRRRANQGIWADIPEAVRFADLDAVFDLRNHQSTIRSLRVGYARKACQLRAAKLSFGHAEPLPAIAAQQA